MLTALLLCACTPQPSRVTYEALLPETRDRQLFLVATRQKERVRHSLEKAGFEMVEDPLEAPFYLRVTLGNEKGFRDCGTLNNVKYALRYEGIPILDLGAAGWTGTCEPNVFDEMSGQLMRRLDGAARAPHPSGGEREEEA